MLKVGAVGCGGIGLAHQNAYKANAKADFRCVCDMDKAKADARAQELGVKAYYSIADMLSAEDLDAVDVVTADTHHFAPVMECLEAGKHTMTEKPIAMDINEARQMVAKAKEKGVQLCMNYNRRFSPAYRKAREWFDAGDHGKLCYMIMKLAQGGPPSDKKGPYYLLYELETHAADLLRWFGGDVTSVCAQMAQPRLAEANKDEPATYTSIAISLKFECEAVATFLASWDAGFTHPIEYLEIDGTLGQIKVDNIMSGVSFNRHDDPDVRSWKPSIFSVADLAFDGSFGYRVASFVDCLLEGRIAEPTGEDGLKALELIQAAIKSFEAKKTVEL